MYQNYSQNVMDGIKEKKQMNDDDKVLLYELNESYTDGFTRGYNRGFVDGIHMLANIYKDKDLLKEIGVEAENETR